MNVIQLTIVGDRDGSARSENCGSPRIGEAGGVFGTVLALEVDRED